MHREKTSHASTVDWASQLTALDRGAYADAVRIFRQHPPSDDPAHRVWRAEVLCHEDRLDEARGEIEGVALDGALDRRARLVLAACDLWDSATDAAEATAREVADEARSAEDRTAEAHAEAMIARTMVRRGDYTAALDLIPLARAFAEECNLAHTAAILDNNEGYACAKAGSGDEGADALGRAIAAFVGLRDRRWEAIARSTWGMWLDDRGRGDEALVEQTKALRIAERHGYERERLWARQNIAQLHLAVGRFEDATTVLGSLLVEERSGRYGTIEAHGLVSLAYAFVLQGRAIEAAEAAESAVFVAEASGAKAALLDARLIRAWGHARRGDPRAVAELRLLVAEAERSTEEQRYRAALYLAEAVAKSRPDEAAALWTKASQSTEAQAGSTFATLLGFVARQLAGHPVFVDDRGRFVVDVSRRNYPTLADATEKLERYLLGRALADSAGNQSEAGRLIGESRSQVCKKLRRHWPDGPTSHRAG